MELRDFRRDSYNGFGEGLARAFELAVTPVIFGAIGFGLDKIFGTVPVFMIALVVFALVGMFIRMWYGYDREMRRHEEERGIAQLPSRPARAARAASPSAEKAAR